MSVLGHSRRFQCERVVSAHPLRAAVTADIAELRRCANRRRHALKGPNESSEIPAVGSYWLGPIRRAVAGDHFLLLLKSAFAPCAGRADIFMRRKCLLTLRRHLVGVFSEQSVEWYYARWRIDQRL
jgi:hypothetical protein